MEASDSFAHMRGYKQPTRTDDPGIDDSPMTDIPGDQNNSKSTSTDDLSNYGNMTVRELDQ